MQMWIAGVNQKVAVVKYIIQDTSMTILTTLVKSSIMVVVKKMIISISLKRNVLRHVFLKVNQNR